MSYCEDLKTLSGIMIYGKILSRSWIPFVIIVNTRVNPLISPDQTQERIQACSFRIFPAGWFGFFLNSCLFLRIQMLRLFLVLNGVMKEKEKLSIFSQKMPIWLFGRVVEQMPDTQFKSTEKNTFSPHSLRNFVGRKTCIIGNGCVVHLPTLLDELHVLHEAGINPKGRLFISDRAHLLFEHHILTDRYQENGRGKKIGTTCRGIGPAYEDKVARRGIRAGQLLGDFSIFTEKLKQNAEWRIRRHGFEIDLEAEINFYKGCVDLLRELSSIPYKSFTKDSEPENAFW